MNANFGGYGNFGIRLPFGVEIGVERELRQEANAQIDAALRGERLRSIVAAGPSVRMLEAPAHGDGAALRAAYWLAVAARVTGDPTLISEAQRYYAMAGTGFWSTPVDIGSTLASAEASARRAGRTDVVAVLNGMRRPYEVARAQERWQLRDVLPTWLADPTMRPWALGGWVAGSAVATIAAVAVVAFVVAPATSTAALGTAYGYARRRSSAKRSRKRPSGRVRVAKPRERDAYVEMSPWDEE